ncbi:autotransporter outer membrane beta-barrel domain-containing protein [Pseudomonas pergaminensis]
MNRSCLAISIALSTLSLVGSTAFAKQKEDIGGREIKVENTAVGGMFKVINGTRTVTDYNITVSGENAAAGAFALGENSYITYVGGKITGSGYDATGLSARMGGQITASELDIDFSGSPHDGLYAGDKSAIKLSNSNITSKSESSDLDSYGVRATSSSSIALENTSVLKTGRGAAVVARRNSTLKINNLDIENGRRIAAEGIGSQAVQISNGSTAVLVNTNVKAVGDNSSAILVVGAGKPDVDGPENPSILFVTGSTLKTEGLNAVGIDVADGDVSINKTDIRSSGAALKVFSDELYRTSVNISDSELFNDTGSAIFVGGNGLSSILVSNSSVKTGSGKLFGLSDSTSTGASVLVGDYAYLEGDIDIAAGQKYEANFELVGETLWAGAGNGINKLSLNNSDWSMAGNSSVQSLFLQNDSQIKFKLGDETFKTLTTGSLAGSGTFVMNTDLSKLKGDLLLVTNANGFTGSHTLVIEDTGLSPKSEGKLRLVGTNGGNGTVVLHGGHVDAGAFRYTLNPEGNDWFLSSAAATPAVENLPAAPAPTTAQATTPISGSRPTTPEANTAQAAAPSVESLPTTSHTAARYLKDSPQTLSKGANAAVAAHIASVSMWDSQVNAVVSRLGELRLGKDEGGVWTRAIGKQVDVSENSSRAFHQNISGLEIGADKAIQLNAGKIYVGGMVGTAKSSLNFGEGASGEIDSKMVGAYATYVDDSGVYVDSALKFDRLNHKIKTPTNLGNSVKGSYDTSGTGVSIELGKHIVLDSGWYLEPQVALSTFRIQGASYTASNGLKVKTDDLNSLQSRIGSRFGRNIQLENGMTVQSYIKASYITEHAGESKVAVNGTDLDAVLKGNRVELGFGGVAKVSQNSKVSLDAEYAKGNLIEQPWGVTLGYRYTW